MKTSFAKVKASSLHTGGDIKDFPPAGVAVKTGERQGVYKDWH